MSAHIVHRTRGSQHGPITRLISPSDLGQVLKPFVFLDLFSFASARPLNLPLHPHSGIATVTVVTEGHFRFSDPVSGEGVIAPGGVEWMRAGGGVWHGKEMTAGREPWIRGFQLWLALPPAFENGPMEAQYIEAEAMPSVGPARVIIGRHDAAQSPVRAFDGVNYLLVTLKPGERWDYAVPADHENLFVAVASGRLGVDEVWLEAGELAILAADDATVRFKGHGQEPTAFVLGSAAPHAHDLILGYYSVHTTPQALAAGEARIETLRRRLEAEGAFASDGASPVFAG